MHPALSVIFFTTLSGAGYGLMFLAAAGIALGRWPDGVANTVLPIATGAALAMLGLAASFAHLGQPQRAWRAFSQWRTSWLSREGVASAVTFVPAALVAALALVAPDAVAQRVAAALLAVGCIVTVFCTARIYSSLVTIRAWHNAYVLPAYLLFALFTGGLWLWTLASWGAIAEEDPWLRIGLPAWLLGAVVLAAMTLAIVKLYYWRHIDTAPLASTPESATGLGRYGTVAAFERPHTEESYITKEMGFVVARRHSARLRAIALLVGLAAPLAAMFVPMFRPHDTPWVATLALIAGSIGVFVERWLFFAEAKHVVTLYYDSSHRRHES
jgi:DMSO reductase anchor subunit